ncbi:carboxypeptidase-like regulatory domain-containing protein, partial [bacterium]|nr:carboxypeptidase-like regulatory domain-containing protein [bacterium]
MKAQIQNFSLIIIVLLTVNSLANCSNTIDIISVTNSESILNGIPLDSQQNQNDILAHEQASYDFSYREFIQSQRDTEPSRILRSSGRSDYPRRDPAVEIDFDDRDVGSNWGTIEVLHDFYAELGVNFRGSNDVDGGGVINQAGNFGVNGHSAPNFLAFNTRGQFPNGGVARPPEFIIFDVPVDIVTINAGASAGGGITMTAFNADDDEIADTELNMQAGMQEMTIQIGGIAYVVIETGVNVFVLDDLYFASLAELTISPESFREVVPIEAEMQEVLTVGNVGEGNLDFRIEILGEGPDWLACEPVEGAVEPEEEIEIEVIINTTDMEPDEYDRIILFNSNDPDRPELEIPVHIFAVAGNGQLFGIVTDASDDRPLEGAHLVLDGFEYETHSNEDGEFDFGGVPAWTYTVIVTIDDYLTTSRQVEIDPNEEVQEDFALLHALCHPSSAEININMGSDEELEVCLTITNSGNGPLTWSMERVFPEGAQAEPWENRVDVDIQQPLNDDFIAGVVFADNRFFVSSGNNGEDVNKIYILNRDYEQTGEFDQFVEDRYGMRDLAWDGNLIWGAVEGTFYGFTVDGDLEASFSVDVNLEGRAIAYDTDRDLLWASDISTSIYGIAPDGEVRVELDNELRIYGLAYYPEDADGY